VCTKHRHYGQDLPKEYDLSTSPITREQTEDLIQLLIKASQAYYSGDEPVMSDAEFDSKQSLLQEVCDTGEYSKLFTEGSDGWRVLGHGDVLLGASMNNQTGSVTDTSTSTNRSVARFRREVTHVPPMLSLQKMKTEDALKSFIQKTSEHGAESFKLQLKLDGLAVSAVYDSDGDLTLISTRGNGTTGEDCTYLSDPESTGLFINFMPASIDMSTLASHVSTTGNSSRVSEFEVRGEVLFIGDQFEKASQARQEAGGEPFSNPRNAGAGLVNRAAKGLGFSAEMTFVVYSILIDGEYADTTRSSSNSLSAWMSRNGFLTADDLTGTHAGQIKVSGLNNSDEVMNSIHALGTVLDGLPFEADGVVVKPTNEAAMLESMGSTSHHPLSQAAWKYPAQQAVSTVKSIEFTVGRTGRITPVAVFEPTPLDGTVVSKASLHNMNHLSNLDVRVGSTVIFEKANEIIPQIVLVVSRPENSKSIPVPSSCPVCNTVLDYDDKDGVWPPRTMTCTNSKCPSRTLQSVVNAVKRDNLDIDGLGPSVVEALGDSGLVSSVADLYGLDEATLAALQTGTSSIGSPVLLGSVRASKIVDQIEKSKSLPFSRLLSSLGIPQIGRRASRKIAEHFETIDNLLAASTDELSQVPTLGGKRAEILYEGLQANREVISTMRSLGVLFTPDQGSRVSRETSADNTSGDSSESNDNNLGQEGGAISTSRNQSSVAGLSFSISGKVPEPFINRNEMVDFIESNGGEFHSSPKASTTYMIADSQGSSSKIVKAHKHNVKFISPEEFTKQFCV
jgi:DNA ligase (NAD+)